MMVQYMYTQQLHDGTSPNNLMRLLQLGDEYSVPTLRLACLQQLNTTPTSEWSAEVQMQLCSMVDQLDSDACAVSGELQAAAKVLRSRVHTVFLQLELLWRSAEWRERFCALPSSIVTEVLGSDDLVVASEDTAMVAALSWLRTGGSRAAAAERRAVLQQVRLLKLSPACMTWFLQYALEARTMPLPALLLTKLAYYTHMGATDATRKDLQDSDVLLRSWAVARVPAAVGSQALELTLEASWGTQEILDAVEKFRVDKTPTLIQRGATVPFKGMEWSAALEVSKSELITGAVRVWVGLLPSLVVAGVKLNAANMYVFTYAFTLGVGAGRFSTPARYTWRIRAESQLLIGSGISFMTVTPEDDPSALLSKHTADGQLAMTASLV
jgi:hypothetical protein